LLQRASSGQGVRQGEIEIARHIRHAQDLLEDSGVRGAAATRGKAEGKGTHEGAFDRAAVADNVDLSERQAAACESPLAWKVARRSSSCRKRIQVGGVQPPRAATVSDGRFVFVGLCTHSFHISCFEVGITRGERARRTGCPRVSRVGVRVGILRRARRGGLGLRLVLHTLVVVRGGTVGETLLGLSYKVVHPDCERLLIAVGVRDTLAAGPRRA
jgi:hypothetical protein